MTTITPMTESPYVRDLLQQGKALRDTLQEPLPDELVRIAARLGGPHPPFLILTGMGSSFHALHPLAIRLGQCGLRTVMLETSELNYYWNNLLGKDTIVIAVSQSGRSAEILRLIEINQGRSLLIGVTNHLDSPLSRAANAVAFIRAGEESSVSCKTYVCSLLVLSRIAEVLISGRLSAPAREAQLLPDSVDGYLSFWQEHVAEAQLFLDQIRHLVLVGRGVSLASAGTGGLIIKEAACFPAEGMSAAAFRHGPIEIVNPHLLLLVFRGHSESASLNMHLAADVARFGGRTQIVSEDSPSHLFRIPVTVDSLRPIAEILPVQMLTLALAARQGREAGVFSRASKITSLE